MLNALAAQQHALKGAIVRGASDAGVAGRLHIYQQAYPARLIAALRDNFGVLPQVLGDAAFDALAQAYLGAHPSRHASIRWFGDALPAFMAAHPALVPHAALTDLARMEWALRGAFDAADAAPIGVAALAEVPADAWSAIVFTPLPSVQLLALTWRVEPVWRALQDIDGDDAPDLPEPSEEAHGLVVWRAGLTTRWRTLEPLPARLLQAALCGEPFAVLCMIAADALGEAQAAPLAAGVLRGWIDDGLFSAWRVAPNGAEN